MRLYTPQRNPIEVNLTPLIDIVFLLLIFFMVSTTFTKETRLMLELPEASGEPADQQQGLEISVGADSAYAINGRALAKQTLQALLAGIAAASVDTAQPVILTADRKAPHSAVVQALDALGQLGFSNIQITTQAPSD